MPITKSTRKNVRKSSKRAIQNAKKIREMKNTLKKIKALISQGKKEEAKKLLPQVYKILDKAGKTGLIKKNTAARKKSRIAKAIK